MPGLHPATERGPPPPYQSQQPAGIFGGRNSAGRSSVNRQFVSSSPSERMPFLSQAPTTYNATPAFLPSNSTDANSHGPLPYCRRRPPDSLMAMFWIATFLFILLIVGLIGCLIGSYKFGDAFVENSTRQQWAVEHKQYEEWKLHTITEHAKWNVEIEEHNKLTEMMEIERRIFAVELKDMNVARALWAEEQAHWDVERKEEMEERRRQREREAQREDEERNRAGMTWTPIQRDQRCFRYGTRRYWAKLENIPRGFNHIRECRIMKASINGRMVTPTYCDDKGGVVVGTWEIDFGEGDCAPIWSNIWQKDCTAPGSGLRWKRNYKMYIQTMTL